jgi:hypothetical protein
MLSALTVLLCFQLEEQPPMRTPWTTQHSAGSCRVVVLINEISSTQAVL